MRCQDLRALPLQSQAWVVAAAAPREDEEQQKQVRAVQPVAFRVHRLASRRTRPHSLVPPPRAAAATAPRPPAADLPPAPLLACPAVSKLVLSAPALVPHLASRRRWGCHSATCDSVARRLRLDLASCVTGPTREQWAHQRQRGYWPVLRSHHRKMRIEKRRPVPDSRRRRSSPAGRRPSCSSLLIIRVRVQPLRKSQETL